MSTAAAACQAGPSLLSSAAAAADVTGPAAEAAVAAMFPRVAPGAYDELSSPALTFTFICHDVVCIVARLSTMCEKFKLSTKFSDSHQWRSCELACERAR
jgi:hypothetical protein